MVKLDIEKDELGYYNYVINFRVHERELSYFSHGHILDLMFLEIKRKFLHTKNINIEEKHFGIPSEYSDYYRNFPPFDNFPINVVYQKPIEEKEKEFDNPISQLEA